MIEDLRRSPNPRCQPGCVLPLRCCLPTVSQRLYFIILKRLEATLVEAGTLAGHRKWPEESQCWWWQWSMDGTQWSSAHPTVDSPLKIAPGSCSTRWPRFRQPDSKLGNTLVQQKWWDLILTCVTPLAVGMVTPVLTQTSKLLRHLFILSMLENANTGKQTEILPSYCFHGDLHERFGLILSRCPSRCPTMYPWRFWGFRGGGGGSHVRWRNIQNGHPAGGD